MDVFTAVKERRSIRKFLKKDISEDVLDKLVDALIWAPSAGNLQSRKFFFISDEKTKGRLASAALNQGFISDAPVIVVCCADTAKASPYGQRGIELYALQDVSASIMAMMLVAHEAGLGTCWVGAFKDEEVSRVLGLGNMLRPVAIVPVGYPAKIPKPTSRVSRTEAVEFR
ncbi:MAG: nitroreductase family protein [Nitrospirae bacterium]|nr:MAG: nitroreductase family protein [Nitrospirota bacterium]